MSQKHTNHFATWGPVVRIALFAVLGIASIVSGTSSAALVDRGRGLIYDTVLDITWLQDANYAHTSGYPAAVGGRMTWDEAQTWASNLNFAGMTGWRLPAVRPANGSYFVYGDRVDQPANSYSGLTDLGFNVAHPESELGFNFYFNLGNTGQFDTAGNLQSDYQNVKSGPFINLQNYFYWYGTEYEYSPQSFPQYPNFCVPPVSCAWDFVIGYGDQTVYPTTFRFYAWAVHYGDVATIVDLRELVASATNVGPGKSLAAKATLAQSHYDSGDLTSACVMLKAFIAEAQAQSGKTVELGPAQQLVESAQSIMERLAC